MTGFVKVRLKTTHNPTTRLRAYSHMLIIRMALLTVSLPFVLNPILTHGNIESSDAPVFHNTTPPVSKRLINASGITTFQPNVSS